MAPGLLEKIRQKVKRPRQTSADETASTLSSPIAPPPASRLVPQPLTRPVSQPTPSLTASTDPDTWSLPRLQERLWNVAYDSLKASEPILVGAYEKILSAELHGDEPSFMSRETIDSEIGATAETRRDQMQQLIQAGLDRTQKQASIKRGINEGLQAVQEVRNIVDKAVHAAPEAAIAWVGVCLGLEILWNPISEANDNRKGIAYVLSRMEWYWNLVLLLLDANNADQSSVGLRVQLEKHVVQLYEKLLTYQIKSVCLYHRNWTAVIRRDLLKIDNWAAQLSDIQETEAAVQRDMDQYSTEESKMQLRKLTNTASALEMNLQGIHSAIEGVHSAIEAQTKHQETWHQGDEAKQCLKDLRETDPRDDKTRIQGTKGGLLRDSYLWILDNGDFRRWRNDPLSQLLWIKGEPGKGKTMLLCGIIDELGKEHDNHLSYFFCQATETLLSNATAVLRGLIYLLVIQQPSLISYVREKYDYAGKRLFEDGNAWEALSKILTAMLHDPILDGAILIVDALDECKIGRNNLLDFITRPSRAKWIISSRNWQDIEEKLGRAKQKVRLQLELNQNSISKAVDIYIRYKVEQLVGLKNYDEETSDAIQHHLVSNADGTFLWVALVCQELADPKVRRRHTIDTLKSFPAGLNPFYKRMVEYIGDSKDAHHCKNILAIISVVYRPITLDELKALAESLEDIDQDELEEIISSCGSFLTIRNGVIYFIHQSAKDFLLSKNASEQILSNGVTHQHHTLFLGSLRALSKTLRRDIYSLNAPGFLVDSVSPPEPDPLASIRYSCVFWADHLQDSDSSDIDKVLRDNGTIHRFFQRKYLYWLESLSLLRSMPVGINAVHKLGALVKKAEARQLVELLRDARRFILSQGRAIEIAPLQAYASALIFSPKHSLIRELYEKEEPEWIASKPRMEAHWGNCLQTLDGHSDSVGSVVFSPDGQRIISGSNDKTAKIWDAATGVCKQTLKGHSDCVSSVAFSPDGQRIITGSRDETLKIWDMATGVCKQTLRGNSRSEASVVFLANDQRIATGSSERVKTWDLATGVCKQTLEGHSASVMSVVFSPDGQRIASGSEDKTVKICDIATGACEQTLNGHSKRVMSVVFSPDGQRIASGSEDKTVKIWDIATGACEQTLNGHSKRVMSVVFSPDGQRIASGSDDKTVKIWDIATGACEQTLSGHSDCLRSVVFSPDGQRVVSGSSDTTLKIWDVATGAYEQTLYEQALYEQTLKDHSLPVTLVVFSADSQHVASSSRDRTLKIWDAATGTCEQTLKGHKGTVTSAAFSADSQRIASGSRDDTIKIWNMATGRCEQTLTGHSERVMSVVFSADGQRLASSSHDNTVKIWNTATGACEQTLDVCRTLYDLSFHSPTSVLLSTEIGVLQLDCPALQPIIDNGSTEMTSPCVRHSGWNLSKDGLWVVKDGKEMLWLPPDYRGRGTFDLRSTFAIGCRSGRVLVMVFS